MTNKTMNDLTEAQAVPASTVSTQPFGATFQGTEAGALTTGFTALDRVPAPNRTPMGEDDAYNDVFVSQSPGGVVGRPSGFER